jgi:hypothetical protein
VKSAAAFACIALAAYLPAQTPAVDTSADASRSAEFRAYLARIAPGYEQTYISQHTRLKTLRQRVSERESKGQDTACSHQILEELDWLADDTMDFPRIAARMDDLESSLAHPELESLARQQDPADGGWGRCHTEWFFKVNATYDHITNPANHGEVPRYKLRLLDRINSPEKLRQYFASIAVSDIARTGHDNLRELNESLENLGRMVLRRVPPYYSFDPHLQSVMTDIIFNQLRNPVTGWWGPRYIRNGNTEFVDTLSMTFHMVSSNDGKVPNLGPVMEHLLAVKDIDYPVGWLKNGAYSNHHEMDVIDLFRYGWPYMTDAQHDAAALEIRKIVRWCLDQSLQADGSFKKEGEGDSLEEDTSFGADLLIEAGVFDRANRFWTTEDFPEAAEVRQRIVRFMQSHIASGGAGGTYYAHTLSDLGAAIP